MYSLKEGSKFEDFALMEALSDITQAVSKSTGMSHVQWNFSVFPIHVFCAAPRKGDWEGVALNWLLDFSTKLCLLYSVCISCT